MNHSTVVTKKYMNAQKIDALLQRVNLLVLFNCVEIKHSQDENHRPVWCIEIKETGQRIVCWLNNRKSFESRKDDYAPFLSWLDFYIQDAISIEFQGKIQDESGIGYDSEMHVWGVPDNYFEYVKASFAYSPFWLRWILYYCMHAQCPRSYKIKFNQSIKKHHG